MEQTDSLEQRLVLFEEYLNSIQYGNPMTGESCCILYYSLNISVK